MNPSENGKDFGEKYAEWFGGLNGGATLQKATFLVKAMANAEFDMDAYSKSEAFAHICENVACYANNTDEMSEQVLEYWADKGLKKEMHDADRTGYKWASYVPTEAASCPDKKYPLLFILHGANNPIFLAESYGYADIAAREKLIAVIPENESLEFIDELYAYVLGNYPVDSSRVYMVGFSLGGIMTSRNTIAHPERYAAAGVGGMLFASGSLETYSHQGVDWAPGTFTEEMLAHAAEVKLPVCECAGANEFIHVMPVTKDPIPDTPIAPCAFEGAPPSIQLFQSKNKIASVNNWRRIAGCPAVAEEEVRSIAAASDDVAVRQLGFPFEQTAVETHEGYHHYIGNCVNAQGENLARFICQENTSHWPGRAHCEAVWEFISRFARDPETGKLITLR